MSKSPSFDGVAVEGEESQPETQKISVRSSLESSEKPDEIPKGFQSDNDSDGDGDSPDSQEQLSAEMMDLSNVPIVDIPQDKNYLLWLKHHFCVGVPVNKSPILGNKKHSEKLENALPNLNLPSPSPTKSKHTGRRIRTIGEDSGSGGLVPPGKPLVSNKESIEPSQTELVKGEVEQKELAQTASSSNLSLNSSSSLFFVKPKDTRTKTPGSAAFGKPSKEESKELTDFALPPPKIEPTGETRKRKELKSSSLTLPSKRQKDRFENPRGQKQKESPPFGRSLIREEDKGLIGFVLPPLQTELTERKVKLEEQPAGTDMSASANRLFVRPRYTKIKTPGSGQSAPSISDIKPPQTELTKHEINQEATAGTDWGSNSSLGSSPPSQLFKKPRSRPSATTQSPSNTEKISTSFRRLE
jgi:hypothetical protein